MFKKFLTTDLQETRAGLALLLLRLTVAVLMIPHGYQKLMQYNVMQERFMDFMGLGAGVSLALVIFAEFFCSFFIALGLLTRLMLIPLIITMLVAVISAHHFEIWGDGAAAFMYLIMYLALFVAGAGKFSSDAFLLKEFDEDEEPVMADDMSEA